MVCLFPIVLIAFIATVLKKNKMDPTKKRKIKIPKADKIREARAALKEKFLFLLSEISPSMIPAVIANGKLKNIN